MALMRIGYQVLLDPDLVYAIRATGFFENTGFPLELAVFCDVPHLNPGEVFATIKQFDDVRSLMGIVPNSKGRLRPVARDLFVDTGKVCGIFVSEDKTKASMSFRFAPDRGVTLEIGANTAMEAVSKFPWPHDASRT